MANKQKPRVIRAWAVYRHGEFYFARESKCDAEVYFDPRADKLVRVEIRPLKKHSEAKDGK